MRILHLQLVQVRGQTSWIFLISLAKGFAAALIIKVILYEIINESYVFFIKYCKKDYFYVIIFQKVINIYNYVKLNAI